MAEKSKKPRLRFKGFTETWEQREVRNTFKVTRGYVLAATKTSTTKSDKTPYPVYSSQTKDNGLMGYYSDYLFETAITWTTDGANAGTVRFREGKFYCTNVCGVLLSENGYANKMVAEALNLVAWKYVSKVGNPKLMNNVMGEIEIIIPSSMEEQSQISQLLCQIDNLITLHQCKYLKKIRKKMLGVDVKKACSKTTTWEQRELGKIGSTYTGLSGKSKADFGHGKGKFITYMNVFTNPIANLGTVEPIEIDDKQNTVLVGDVFFTTSSETPEEVGMSCVLTENSPNTYLNSFCFGYRPIVKFDNYYLAYMLRSASFRGKITFLAQGISRYNISKNKVMEIEIPIPDFHEQQKIGAYFRNIDNLITLHQCKYLKKIRKKMLGVDVKKACSKTTTWEQCKLGDISNSYSGGTPTVGNPLYYGGAIPFIRSAEINSEKTELYLTEKGLNNSSAKMVNTGDILYALYGATSGEVGRSRIKGAINQAILAIIPYKEYDAEYLAQLLRRNKIAIIETYLQGGQGNLSGAIVKELEIDIPKLSEQLKIGSVLSKVDNLITLHQREENALFFNKISIDLFLKVAFAWEQREFGKVVNRLTEMACISELPRVEYEDIISGIGLLNKDITKKQSNKSGLLFSQGDILYGKLRPYLKNWLIPSFSGIAVGDFWVLKPENSDSSFIYRLIQTKQFDNVANQSTGTKMPRADWKLVSNTMFYVPILITEQVIIGRCFSVLDNLITLHQRKYDKFVAIKKALLEKMFPRAGKNVPEIRFKGFTETWEQRKLDKVAQYRNGKAHEDSISDKGKYIVVNSKFVSTNGEVIKFSTVQNEPLYENEIAFVLSDVPNGRAIARTFLVNKNGVYTLNQRIAGITPLDNTYPYYLYILMNRHKYFLQFDDGAKQTNLSIKDVLGFESLYPNYKEQQQIGLVFERLDNLITLHQRE